MQLINHTWKLPYPNLAVHSRTDSHLARFLSGNLAALIFLFKLDTGGHGATTLAAVFPVAVDFRSDPGTAIH